MLYGKSAILITEWRTDELEQWKESHDQRITAMHTATRRLSRKLKQKAVDRQKGVDRLVAPGKFWSIIRRKRTNVCHHNAFPYATGVSQISKILESPQKLQTPKGMGGTGWFWKNLQKQKTPLPELSTPVIWPRHDLYSTRQLSAWMDVFLFIMRRDHSWAKFSSFRPYIGWTDVRSNGTQRNFA